MRSLSVCLLLLFPILSIAQTAVEYDKNLDVLRDTTDYKAIVEQSEANRLVDVVDIVPDIVLDIRYATENNFTGEKVYNSEKAFVRLPVAKSLARVQESLSKYGLGLLVFDAYRPYSATVKFYEIYKDTNYVASPWQGSRHNRGAAVDVSIVNIETGEEIQMPTGFDNFTEVAHPDYMNLPQNVIDNREMLISEMQNNGFKVYPYEWWHFDFIGWEAYDLMDISFEQLEIVNNCK